MLFIFHSRNNTWYSNLKCVNIRIKCFLVYRIFYQYLRKSTTNTESQQRCESDKLRELQLGGSWQRTLKERTGMKEKYRKTSGLRK